MLGAMPPEWLPVLERRVLGQVEQRRRQEKAQAATPLKTIAIAAKAEGDGLDIPPFLDRRLAISSGAVEQHG
jgi:hypothetical protein